MAPKVKFDYDSDEFYEEIFTLAFQGLGDAEIADALVDKFKESLEPDTFSAMKNGRYPPWSKEENERRGERIKRVLARGRRKTNAIVRGRYLKAALGGLKTKNVQRVKRPLYDEAGEPVGEEVVQVSETEFESAPNIQALSTWLYHHDPEWRRIQRGQDTEASDVPTDVPQGIDIDAWIRKEIETETEEPQEGSG